MLVVASTIIGLLILEVASRVIMPIAIGTRFVAMDGAPTYLYRDRFHLQPGVSMRQLSLDFDATMSITDGGYRAPAPKEDPGLVFIGDSFTFGMGLTDEETFIDRFCSRRGLYCVNLGMPGTGTVIQARILKTFLMEQGWRPRHVVLTMYPSTQNFFHGNDIVDSLKEASDLTVRAASTKRAAGPGSSSRLLENLLSVRNIFLEHSNIARFFYYTALQYLRSGLSFEIAQRGLEKSLAAIEDSMNRIHTLGKDLGFSWNILIIPPLVELSKGTHAITAAAIQRIAPVPVTSLAPALLPEPRSYFFPADGHLNAAGAERIAGYLDRLPSLTER